MLNLVILALMAAAFLSLAAAVVFLYRFMSRKRLFPQLPRLWKSDRLRFVISLTSFAVLGAAFVALSLMTPAPAVEQAAVASKKPGDAPLGPSFDGQPPPPLPAKAPQQKPVAAGEERALPPASAMAKPETPPAATPQAGVAPQAAVQPPVQPAGAAPKAQPAAAPQAPPAAGVQPAATPPAEPAVQPPAQKPAAMAPTGEKPAQPPAPPAAKQQQAAVQKPAAPPAAPAAAPAVAEPATPKAAPKAEPKPEPKAKPAPKAKAEPKPRPAPKSKPEPPKAAFRPQKTYTVCVASFRQKGDAARDAKKLIARGFKPKVVSVDLGKKGRWYRICLGGFPTPAKAQESLKALMVKGLGGTPFVTRLH